MRDLRRSPMTKAVRPAALVREARIAEDMKRQ
jgi:hypothetical protein